MNTKDGPARDAIFVVPPARPELRNVVLSLVASAVPDRARLRRAGRLAGRREPLALVTWMALAAGIPAAEMREVAPPEVVDLAVRVGRLDGGRQLAWYHANLAPLGDCVIRPQLDSATFAGGGQ